MSAVLARRVIRGHATGDVEPPRLRLVRKYRNKPTVSAGIKFDSKKEAQRHQQLLLLERNGELRNLRLQVSYNLVVEGKLIAKYRADFVYEELRKGVWLPVVEDVKGVRTPVYRLKKILLRAIYGIEIRET
jgi:hypothetical protein